MVVELLAYTIEELDADMALEMETEPEQLVDKA